MKSRMPTILGTPGLMLTPYSWVHTAGVAANDNRTFVQRVLAAIGRMIDA